MPFLSNDNGSITITRLKDGDESAFDELYYLFHPRLVFFANRLLNSVNNLDAEELVQDVFLRFYHRRTQFDSLEHIHSFLYVSTKNACLDQIAKDKVKSKRFSVFISDFSEVEDAIDSQIIYSELISELSKGIEFLPEKCRLIMKQFLEEGKSANEIASTMNISVSTVNNQKARGINLLRRRLTKNPLFLLLIFLLFFLGGLA